MKTITNILTNLFFILIAFLTAIPMMLFYGLTGKRTKEDDAIDSMIKATEGKYYRVRNHQEGEA
jgi:hypothetical protein